MESRRTITANFNSSQLFHVIAQQAGHILAHDTLLILLCDADPDAQPAATLDMAFCHPPTLVIEQPRPMAAFSFGSALLANQPIIVEDFATTAAQHAGDQRLLDTHGCAAMIIPIEVESRALGGLMFISKTPNHYRLE